MQRANDKSLIVSSRIYSLLLFAYPANFRRDYGSQMILLFRDCYRAEGRQPKRLFGFWLRTLIDLLKTAPRERLQDPGKGVDIMKAIRNLVIAIIIYAVVIILTHKFLQTARFQLPFAVGTFIDALVSIGVLFNFIVLLLVSTRVMKATRAVITSAIATFVLILGALLIISMRVPAEARPPGISNLMIVVSFLIWFGLHWLWAQRKTQTQPAIQ
jgi:hypothetical protein